MTRFLRFASVATLTVAAVALCSSANAQQGRPGGGRPGFGMFGGENASLTMMYGFLLNSPTVQKELDLIDDQQAEIKAANEKSRTAMRELFSGMRDLNEEQRRAKMEELGKKMQAQAEEMSATIKKTLLPAQLKRLREIAIQVAGTRALSDKDVQQELKLSADQTTKIKAVGEETQKKVRDLFGGGDRQDVRSKMQDLRKDAEKKVMDVLSADQKAAFEKLQGKKVEIPTDEMRGPGGRRSRGNGQQQGN